VVNTRGEVHACIWLMGQDRFRLGDVGDAYLREETLLDLIELLHVDNLPQCRNCQWRYLCGGGCPVRRVSVEPNRRADPRVLDYYNRMTCLQAQTVLELLLWDQARQRLAGVRRERPQWGCLGPTV